MNFSSGKRQWSCVWSNPSPVRPVDYGRWTIGRELAHRTAAMPRDMEPEATLAGPRIRMLRSVSLSLGSPCRIVCAEISHLTGDDPGWSTLPVARGEDWRVAAKFCFLSTWSRTSYLHHESLKIPLPDLESYFFRRAVFRIVQTWQVVAV